MTRPAPTSSASSTSPPRHDNRDTIFDVVARTAEHCFMPLTVGGGVRQVDDIRKLLLAGADKVSINTAAVNEPGFRRRGGRQVRRPVHRRRHRRQEGVRRRAKPTAGRSSPMAAATPTGIDAVDFAARGRRARRRRDPADLDGPRRHQVRLRHRADPRRRRCGARAGHRLGRRRHARPPGRGHPRRPRQRRCSPPRSSISAPTRSPRPRRIWPRPAWPMRLRLRIAELAKRDGR